MSYQIQNEHLLLEIDVSNGIALTRISDKVTGHEYLRFPYPLFEFSVNDGPVYQSTNGVVVTGVMPSADGTAIFVLAEITTVFVGLRFSLDLATALGDTAAILRLTVTNTSEDEIVLKTVYPRIRGLVTRGHPRDMMGMVPHEIGSVVPLQAAPPGAHLAVVLRHTETAANTAATQEDLFVVGYDGAVWSSFVVHPGGWATPFRLTQPGLARPGSGIAAVNRNDSQIDVFVVGYGGQLWIVSTKRDKPDPKGGGTWGGWTEPMLLSEPRLAPTGAQVAAVMRNSIQEDVFVVGTDGAVWSTFQVNNSHWDAPIPLTPTGLAPPGAGIAAVARNDRQLDAFVVDEAGAVSHTWTFFDQTARRWSGWQPPVQRMPPGCAPAGASIAAVMRDSAREDVFVVGADGAIWSAHQVKGPDVNPDAFDDGWTTPTSLTPTGQAPPGAGVVAMRRGDLQVDIFVVDGSGAITTTSSTQDAPDHWQTPFQLTGPGFIPPGGALVSIMRTAAQQDLSTVAYDGALWTTFELHNAGWAPPISLASVLGAPGFYPWAGLPTNMNTMEVAGLYDRRGGGGLFFACLGGDLMAGESPLQFNLSATEVVAFWRTELPPARPMALPGLAVGVHHTGDWHAAIDYYTARNQWSWRHPEPPAWFREAGGIYSFAGAGSGGIYMEFDGINFGTPPNAHAPASDLKGRIGHFANLHQLLDEARELGTNVIYVWDYWEHDGVDKGDHYRNKGDYKPRSDMGGDAAFKAGIAAVRSAGGRVILYVEPFIIWHISDLGRSVGESWKDLLNDPFYGRDNFTMIAAFRPWQDRVVAVAEQLVEYGADGIYLDSWGWQWNWPMMNSLMSLSGDRCTPWEYSRGVLQLADRVRDAIGPDRVVLCESTSGQLGQYVHGGLSSDLSQKVAQQRWRNQNRILASPVRYGMPQVNFISNGLDMNELHQIYAAGHPLALCWNWHSYSDDPDRKGPDVFMHFSGNRDQIKQLLTVRNSLKNALVYGRQTYQPDTGDDDVAAYFYEGTSTCVLTVVNTSTIRPYSGCVQLRLSEASKLWYKALADPTISLPAKSDGAGRLPLAVPAAGLGVYWMDR